jgi:hypothetical protein
MVRGVDYTATDGTTVTGLTALVADDVVEVFSVVARTVADVYTQTQSDNRFVNKIGGVFNVVSTTKTDVFSMDSTAYTDVTGLSVTITPSSTTSKILVIANISTGNIGANHNTFSIVRNSTLIAQPPTDTYSGSIGVSLTSSTDFKSASLTHLDSPNSTSPQTYKIQMKTSNGAATAYVNRRGDLASVSAVSSITVIEVGA